MLLALDFFSGLVTYFEFLAVLVDSDFTGDRVGLADGVVVDFELNFVTRAVLGPHVPLIVFLVDGNVVFHDIQ